MYVPIAIESGNSLCSILFAIVVDKSKSLTLSRHLILSQENSSNVAEWFEQFLKIFSIMRKTWCSISKVLLNLNSEYLPFHETLSNKTSFERIMKLKFGWKMTGVWQWLNWVICKTVKPDTLFLSFIKFFNRERSFD